MQYKFEMFHAINNSHTSALRIKQFKPLMNYTYRENLYNLQLSTYKWFIVRVLITLISSSWSLNSTKTLNFDDEDRNSRSSSSRRRRARMLRVSVYRPLQNPRRIVSVRHQFRRLARTSYLGLKGAANIEHRTLLLLW